MSDIFKAHDIKKSTYFRLVLIRMFNTMFVVVDVLGDQQYTNFGRVIVFSADLCYNGVIS